MVVKKEIKEYESHLYFLNNIDTCNYFSKLLESIKEIYLREIFLTDNEIEEIVYNLFYHDVLLFKIVYYTEEDNFVLSISLLLLCSYRVMNVPDRFEKVNFIASGEEYLKDKKDLVVGNVLINGVEKFSKFNISSSEYQSILDRLDVKYAYYSRDYFYIHDNSGILYRKYRVKYIYKLQIKICLDMDETLKIVYENLVNLLSYTQQISFIYFNIYTEKYNLSDIKDMFKVCQQDYLYPLLIYLYTKNVGFLLCDILTSSFTCRDINEFTFNINKLEKSMCI